MILYELSIDTKDRIEKSTGIEFEKIQKMDWEEIDNRLSIRINKKIDFPKNKKLYWRCRA